MSRQAKRCTPIRACPNGSPNTAYTVHFASLNFGLAEISYMLRMLSEMPKPALKRKIFI